MGSRYLTRGQQRASLPVATSYNRPQPATSQSVKACSHCLVLSHAQLSRGHCLDVRLAECTLASMRRMANSAQTVLPEPVGAATKQLSSVLYSAVNTCAEHVLLTDCQ